MHQEQRSSLILDFITIKGGVPMAQEIIGNMWNRESRNDINKNFSELYSKYINFVGEVTEDIRQALLEGAEIHFIDPVATVDDLPSDVINGDTSFVKSSGAWYRWNGNAWEVVAETDPSEFISLQGEFNTLKNDTDVFKTAMNNSFEDFKLDVNNDIDDRLGDLQGLLQGFIDEIEQQVIYVEEEGNNEHGHYIRYSDGKQEVWCNPIRQVPNVSAGSIYRSESSNVTYPKPFLVDTYLNINAIVTSYNRWAEASTSASTNDYATVGQFSYIEGVNAYSTYVYAVGRWK